MQAAMNFTQSIFRNSWLFFVLILAFAFWGFWVTYFTRPAGTVSGWEHLHGVAMFGWCAMLIIQASLIRTNRRSLHRGIGKLSIVLVPLIIYSTLWLANFRINQRALSDEGLYVLGLQLFLLLLFVVFYVQAMRHRARPDVHARWMICTSLTLLDPIFARVIGVNFLQVPLESLLIQYITFAMTDIILLALLLRDLKTPSRRDVFQPALVMFVLAQAAMLLLWKTQTWATFAGWFAGLPMT